MVVELIFISRAILRLDRLGFLAIPDGTLQMNPRVRLDRGRPVLPSSSVVFVSLNFTLYINLRVTITSCRLIELQVVNMFSYCMHCHSPMTQSVQH